MTKEQIQQEAEAAFPYHKPGASPSGVDYEIMDALQDMRKGYVTAATKYFALLEKEREQYHKTFTDLGNKLEEKDKEIERLRNWKIEASYLLNPILEYGQGHKEIPIGGSITEHVLSWAKRYHEQKVELARLTAEAQQSLLLYNNMTATIVKRDEEIERLKETLNKVRKECPDGSWFAKTIDKALNTYKPQ